jgi:jumonji domain-containing protein 2
LLIGSWKSVFGWHKEEFELYSANYLHVGQAKIWHSVAQKHTKKFEILMEQNFEEGMWPIYSAQNYFFIP